VTGIRDSWPGLALANPRQEPPQHKKQDTGHLMVDVSHQTLNQQPALPRHAQLEPVLDWMKLAHLDELELVHHSGKSFTSGRVDMLAADGSVFWLIQNEGKGRAMFLTDDDVVIFRHRRTSEQTK
jgi:hypothetical protein